jgi:hypothetical protein
MPGTPSHRRTWIHLSGDGHGELVPRAEKMDVLRDLEVRDLAGAVLTVWVEIGEFSVMP